MPLINKKDAKKDIQTVRWLWGCTDGQKRFILLLILSNAVGALISVFYALVCKEIVDGAVGTDWNRMVRGAVFLFTLIFTQILLGLVSDTIRQYVLAKLRIRFQNGLLEKLMEKEYASITFFHSGELQNRLFSDVNVVVNGIVSILPVVAWLFFRLAGAAAVLIALAPEFTLMFLIAGTLICVVMTLLRGKLKNTHKRVQEAEGQVRSYLQETLESILVVKVFRAEERVLRKAEDFQNRYFTARIKRSMMGNLAGAGFGLLFQLGYFLAMVWGCLGIFRGTMTYGTLTAMLQLVNQIQSPFSGFSSLISQFYTMLASAERILELEMLPEEDEEEKLATEKEEKALYQDLDKISFDHVDFTYGRTPVLNDVNFCLKKGEFVSLTGLSGGGKSTLFLLLLGAYWVSDGKIRFCFENGEEKQPGREMRRLFAYVPQGNYLFSGTLRENVTFLNESVEDSRIWDALRLACAEEFVKELPEGLDTVLGEKGHGLSQGQMQRIAVARALLSDAPILLLDEATSALDEDTEAELLRNIESLKNRTCIIVTHRKAALAICRKHLVLSDGCIAED